MNSLSTLPKYVCVQYTNTNTHFLFPCFISEVTQDLTICGVFSVAINLI